MTGFFHFKGWGVGWRLRQPTPHHKPKSLIVISSVHPKKMGHNAKMTGRIFITLLSENMKVNTYQYAVYINLSLVTK